jgi:VWFA-related protein
MNVGYYSLIALLALSVPTLAYQAPSADSQVSSSAKTSNDNQIQLDVFVSDKSDRPAPGLSQQDFTVLDNKHPQPITSFHAFETPLTGTEPAQLILLVDTVNASYPTVTYERNDIKRFLHQNNGRLAHPVSIVFFSDNGAEVINSPSRDGNALSVTLDRYEYPHHSPFRRILR